MQNGKWLVFCVLQCFITGTGVMIWLPWCQWSCSEGYGWRIWIYLLLNVMYVNTLRPRQNGRQFADGIFKCIFLNENVLISIKVSLKFIPKGQINNIPILDQIMALCRPGDNTLSEPMMIIIPMHICVTRRQWVKEYGWNKAHQSNKNNNITITNKARQNIIKNMGIFHGIYSIPPCPHYQPPYIPAPRGMTIIPALPHHCHDNQNRFPHIHKTYLMTVRTSGDGSSGDEWLFPLWVIVLEVLPWVIS